MIPVAYLIVGPLSDRVFEPLMADDGALSETVGAVIGSGPGRGYALFFVAVGVFVFAASAAAWAYPPLRHLERDVPDAGATSTSPVTEIPGV